MYRVPSTSSFDLTLQACMNKDRWTAALHSGQRGRRINFKPARGVRAARRMDCLGDRVALQHIIGAEQQVLLVCVQYGAAGACMVHGLQNFTVVHLGGEMSAEAPARTWLAGRHCGAS